MTISELLALHAEKNHIFEPCEVLREVVEWMNSRKESLNQGKTSTDTLIREFLNEKTK